MVPQERRRRALDRGLFLAERVERVASATWLVPSQSDPSGAHAVALIDGHLRCDCFASLAGHPCAHAAAVCLVLLAGPVRVAREQEPDAPAASDIRRSA
jgi:hypothetical protein